jgi:hypothetical protein
MDSRRSPPAAAKPASPTVSRPGRPAEEVDDSHPSPHQVERVMGHLERALDDLRVEYEKFFSGQVKLPPEPARLEIQRDLRLLRGKNLRSTAEQFRLGAIEARFNSLSEMFNRRVRSLEEGRGPSRPAPPPPPRPRASPVDGVVVGAVTDREQVGALLEELRRRGGTAGSFDLERFASYLEQQAGSIRARTGCDAVQFRLAEEDGRVKLKARPLPAAGS